MSDELPILWQYSFSNYNEKARWALDFKRIRHRRHSMMPGWPRAFWFTRGDRTVPVLDLDGRRIMDSTRIIAALEERSPEPTLYPADPDGRQRALELEDFFDEHAGHDMRRVGFWELHEDIPYALEYMTIDQPRIAAAVARVGLRAAFPFAWRYMSARYDFSEEAVKRSRTTLIEALDRIESERAERAYLVGDRFTVADLTAAALLYPLVWPTEFQYPLPERRRWKFLESHADHPALGWISEMWHRHRGSSAAV